MTFKSSLARVLRGAVCPPAFCKLPLLALAMILLVFLSYSCIFLLDASAASEPGKVPDAKAPLDAETAGKLKDDVEHYLEWVIGIAGIFVIAQTVAAGFAAQSFSDQFKESIGRADKSVQATVAEARTNFSQVEKELRAKLDETTLKLEEFRRKYEDLVVAEDKRRGALGDLIDNYVRAPGASGAAASEGHADILVEGLDWRDGLYAAMENSPRQRLLSIERYLGYDLKLDISDGNTPSVLRVLANFYVSKFEYEKRFGSAHIGDLERAQYLLQLWVEQRPTQFEIRNDLGLVFSRLSKYFAEQARASGVSTANKEAAECFEKWYRMRAKDEFHFSLGYCRDQQRAPYNLAVIAKEHEGNLPLAIEYLETARHVPVWEHRPNESMLAIMLYNLACYRALDCVARNDLSPVQIDAVVGLLRDCAKYQCIPAAVVTADFNSNGDFYEFCKQVGESGEAGRNAVEVMKALQPTLSAGRKQIARCITE